ASPASSTASRSWRTATGRSRRTRTTPMSNGNKDPNAPPAPDDTRFGELANIRGRYMQEMQDNPDLRRRFAAMAPWEVGTDNDAAKQAFVESVFNRAASRGQTLDTALHSIHIKKTQKGYFDPRTGAHADDPVSPEDQATWNGFIDRALAGSNVSGLSTGNQSPDKDPNFKLLPPR